MATSLRLPQVAALVSSVGLLCAFVGYRVWSARQREAAVRHGQAVAQSSHSTIPPVTTKRGTMVEPQDLESSRPSPPLMSSSKDMMLLTPNDVVQGQPAPPPAAAAQRRMFSSSKSGAIVEPVSDARPPVLFSGSKSGYIWPPAGPRASPSPADTEPPRLKFSDVHMSGSKVMVIMTPQDAVFDPYTRMPAPPPGAASARWNPNEIPFWAKTFWWWRGENRVHGNDWDWAADLNEDEPATQPQHEPGK